MKKLYWRITRFGGAGCAIVGAAVAAHYYGDNKKQDTISKLFRFPSRALCSKVNQNANIVDAKNSLCSPNQVGALESRKSIRVMPDHENKCKIKDNLTLEEAKEKASELCQRLCSQLGLPGLAVGVSVNGKLVWEQGYGYGNLENLVPMNPRMIMRIASISKPMTMAMLGKLMDQGLIDIDLPIQTYLPEYPIKCVDGKQVTVTTRHLLSHLSGIRHYTKKGEPDNEDEMTLKEYFIKDHFDTVEQALEIFKNDDLLHEPGTKFLYSTHGWTVVSAIIEKIVQIPFDKYCKITFQNTWGLKNTFLDEQKPIIYNRASYYTKKNGILQNSPYVDNSLKWAGGGFLSNTTDLLQFAHMMIYSYQYQKSDESKAAPYLSKETIQKIWTGNPKAARLFLGSPTDNHYGLGFTVADALQKCMFCKTEELVTVSHSGAAVGATSILLMKFPKQCETNEGDTKSAAKNDAIKAVVVAMITNVTDSGLSSTAEEIGNLFKHFL